MRFRIIAWSRSRNPRLRCRLDDRWKCNRDRNSARNRSRSRGRNRRRDLGRLSRRKRGRRASPTGLAEVAAAVGTETDFLED